ncbi:MAG: hydrolase [Cyclobacteriaceae bacterium]|nr:hydrolase [Cyclobacteriaceae bacterium]
MKFFIFSSVLLLLVALRADAQNKPGTELRIRKTTDAIKLDGVLDEPAWKAAQVATDFFMNFPYDTALAPFQTEARLTFDEHNLYVSYVCYDDDSRDLMQSLRRDFDFDGTDNIGIYLGPYNDRINGFYFQVTPFGVQAEGTIAGGGSDDGAYSDTWDNKWYSHVTREKDKWIAELAIPFKSFRYKNELTTWNVTFLRWDRKRNLVSSWVATPIQFIPASFAYSGNLIWEEPPPHHTTNISIIPYVAGGLSADKQTEPTTNDSNLQAGFDAKVAVTPSLNLDLTFNPDFSQVEVDRQVINLTRFEFQFPERRQFFLENSDLFDRAGFPEARPFFSRRIGLARDTSGVIRLIPILYGARLSGSLSKDWRISVLNMQTREKQSMGLPAQNFSVAAIQRNFWKQSNIQISMVNKQSLGINEGDSLKYFNTELWRDKVVNGDTIASLNKYNRVLTVDLETRNPDNSWYASLYASKSFDDFNATDNMTGGGFVQHTKRNYQFFFGHTFIQKNYNAEVGFVPLIRVYPGLANSFISGNGTFFPKSKILANMGPGLDLSLRTIPGGTVTDRSASVAYNFNFLNTSNLSLSYGYTYQFLTNSFNPIDPDRYTTYNRGEEYDWRTFSIGYESDQRPLFRYSVEVNSGGFYNGTNLNINGELSYRYQPYGSLSITFDYNDLKLPENYGTEKLFLVGPRLDLTFTDKIFLTTFAQYNNLAENVNLNARFQWRYKPASDFFIVYTENYFSDTFRSKNRALVFKFTYWLNL